ncbi:hypothetical protein [Roseivivax sp.]
MRPGPFPRAPRAALIPLACALSLAAGGAGAATCASPEAEMLLDWSGAGWKSGARSASLPAERRAGPEAGPADAVGLDLSGATSRIRPGYPEASSEFTGGRGAGTDSLALLMDFANNSEALTLRFDFPRAVEGLSFAIFDIDYLPYRTSRGRVTQRGFRDGVEITGWTAEGAAVTPQLSSPHIPPGARSASGASIYLGSPLTDRQAVGYERNAAPADDMGNLEVRFAQPVAALSLRYTNGLYPPSSNPQAQAIALSDLSYCAPLGAELSVSKSQRVISEDGAACATLPADDSPAPGAPGGAAIPGACIEYRIAVTNEGDAPARQIALSDRLDAALIFQAARATGFAGGTSAELVSHPAKGTRCAAGACTVALDGAELSPGASGALLIRAKVR